MRTGNLICICKINYIKMEIIIKSSMSKKEIKNQILKLQSQPSAKGFDSKKFENKIKLTIDPINFQKKLRNDWK